MAAAKACEGGHTRACAGWRPDHPEGEPMALSLVAAKAVSATRPIPVPLTVRMARMARMMIARVVSLILAN